jgi:hypothetical protein
VSTSLTRTYRYTPPVLDELARHGLRPGAGTSPHALRDAVRDLYKYELRRLRDALIAGRIRKPDYAAHVVRLRERYPILSLPLEHWTLRSGRHDASETGRAHAGP